MACKAPVYWSKYTTEEGREDSLCNMHYIALELDKFVKSIIHFDINIFATSQFLFLGLSTPWI